MPSAPESNLARKVDIRIGAKSAIGLLSKSAWNLSLVLSWISSSMHRYLTVKIRGFSPVEDKPVDWLLILYVKEAGPLGNTNAGNVDREGEVTENRLDSSSSALKR